MTASRLASEEATFPQSPAVSAGKVASLVKRIRYLRALLLHLAQGEPSYAHTLAPELRTLRRLLSELSPTQPPGLASSHPAPSVVAGDTAVGPTPVAELAGPLAAVPASTLDAYVPEAPAPQVGGNPPAGGVAVLGASASAPNAAGGAFAPSAAPQSPALLTNLSGFNGPSRSASAPGASTGTVGTLAAMCAVRVHVGLLSDRLSLVVLPWRLAVLRHRLERPG